MISHHVHNKALGYTESGTKCSDRLISRIVSRVRKLGCFHILVSVTGFFFCLIFQSIYCVLLWDVGDRSFLGLLRITRLREICSYRCPEIGSGRAGREREEDFVECYNCVCLALHGSFIPTLLHIPKARACGSFVLGGLSLVVNVMWSWRWLTSASPW